MRIWKRETKSNFIYLQYAISSRAYKLDFLLSQQLASTLAVQKWPSVCLCIITISNLLFAIIQFIYIFLNRSWREWIWVINECELQWYSGSTAPYYYFLRTLFQWTAQYMWQSECAMYSSWHLSLPLSVCMWSLHIEWCTCMNRTTHPFIPVWEKRNFLRYSSKWNFSTFLKAFSHFFPLKMNQKYSLKIFSIAESIHL